MKLVYTFSFTFPLNLLPYWILQLKTIKGIIIAFVFKTSLGLRK